MRAACIGMRVCVLHARCHLWQPQRPLQSINHLLGHLLTFSFVATTVALGTFACLQPG